MCSRIAVVAALLLLVASPASAECDSYIAGGNSLNFDWVEYSRNNYTICYTSGNRADRDYIRTWVDKALRLGRSKYGVRSFTYGDNELRLTIYLPSEPTGPVWDWRGSHTCCFDDRHDTAGRNGEIVKHAEIHMITPSVWDDVPWSDHDWSLATEWGRAEHAGITIHEMTHFFQWACCHAQAREDGYKIPDWVIEGMAEYDEHMHATDYSRERWIPWLGDDFLENETHNVVAGRDLNLDRSFQVPSKYRAGWFVMTHLEDEYGEKVHKALLLDELRVVLDDLDSSILDLFAGLWVRAERMKDERDDEGLDAAGYSATRSTLSPTTVPPPTWNGPERAP